MADAPKGRQRVSQRISVRHTDVTRADLADIQRVTGVTSTSEAIANALSLYAAYLKLAPGAAMRVTGHTREGDQ
jgi:hypothetical protein